MGHYLPLLLGLCLGVLLPSLHCGPQYSGNKHSSVDDGTLNDIFGSSLDTARYGNDDDEWEEVPITLLPGDAGCEPLQQPRKEPEMMKLHEEFRQIEVIKATGNNKCDFYKETQGFECVPYYQCNDGTIITDGYGLIDIRFGGSDEPEPELAVLDSTDLMCPGSLDVCCKDPDFVSTTEKPKEDLTQTTQEEDSSEEVSSEEDSSEEEFDDVVVVETYTNEPAKFVPTCGRRNSFGLGVRIQNYQDDEAQFGEWPHMCAILRREIISGGGQEKGGYGQQQQEALEEEVMVFQAGASLIGAGVVMTGAHKVKDFVNDATSLIVRCGEWDTQTEGEPLPHQDRNVKEVVLHPEFNKGNLVNTIAILFLEEEFVLADHIDTICLPDYQDLYEDSSECFVKGWGKDHFGQDAEYQVVLKEVSLPVVPRDQCVDWLRVTRLGKRFRLDQSFMCAGGEAGKDACRGDGGGPLVCLKKDDPEHYVQVGIVAWGIGCGEENVPGVYTDVAEQACWIDWVLACHDDKYTLRQDQRCNDWLHKKQAHKFAPLRNIYKACDITWPTVLPEPYTGQTKDTQQTKGTKGTLPEKIRTKTPAQTKTKTKTPGGY